MPYLALYLELHINCVTKERPFYVNQHFYVYRNQVTLNFHLFSSFFYCFLSLSDSSFHFILFLSLFVSPLCCFLFLSVFLLCWSCDKLMFRLSLFSSFTFIIIYNFVSCKWPIMGYESLLLGF